MAKGKIVSSKILDVTVTPAMNETLEDDKINTVTIKYVDAHDKSIRKTTFDILNQEALYELLRNSLKISEFAKKARIYDEKITYFDEKIKNIEEKLDKILEQLDTIANNDVTESSIENHPKLDFNTLSIYGIDNGKEYDLKVDILDVEKYKYFKHQVL